MSEVKIRFIEAGFAEHMEAMTVQGGKLGKIKFPASVAVIEHPKHGVALFDTGYSPRFFQQTRHFPNRFYALITPVTIDPKHTAIAQLKNLGIDEKDVKKVILSHFHADHIAGVSDFPMAEYIYRSSAYQAVCNLSSWGALRAGFLRGLLPDDFTSRSRPLTDHDFVLNRLRYPGFERGYDVFGDGSVVAVDLPGHALGQIGLFVTDLSGQDYFLVADACWGKLAFTKFRPPNRIAGFIFEDWNVYQNTLGKLHHLSNTEKSLKIVPCHCGQSIDELCHAHVTPYDMAEIQ